MHTHTHTHMDMHVTHSAGARWFFLHSVANWAIAAMSLEDLIYVTKHPLCAMLAPVATWKPSQLAFALHVYHLLAFTKLRAEDIRYVFQ